MLAVFFAPVQRRRVGGGDGGGGGGDGGGGGGGGGWVGGLWEEGYGISLQIQMFVGAVSMPQ